LFTKNKIKIVRIETINNYSNQLFIDCTLSILILLVKERCNDIERQNILATFPEKSLLTLYRELNSSWGKKLYTECCSRKERSE
jgi:hypothetical protein